MRKYLYLFALLTLTGCNTLNKVITSDDTFKNSRTISMNQEIKSVSDRTGSTFLSAVHYEALLNWHGSETSDNEPAVTLTLGVETSVRKDVLDPEIFFQVNSKKYNFSPIERRLENFGKTHTSTSVETTSDRQTEKKDDTEKTSEKLTTSSSTTSSSVPVRYIQYRYNIERKVVEEISGCKDFSVRFYLGDEGVSTNFRANQLAALKKFARRFLAL
jgi:hypothetical protein